MKLPDIQFNHAPAERKQVPLIVQISGPSGSGKTYSALRFAKGLQAAGYPGKIWGIDTEAGRMNHYADYFEFEHVPFPAPRSALHYAAMIERCYKEGGRIMLVDTMSHEHDGIGGMMDQSEEFLEKKCGLDADCRNRNLMVSLVRPKAHRKHMNQIIEQMADVAFILCYRAKDTVKPKPGEGMKHTGWETISTNRELIYLSTVRFLLAPMADGKPTTKPAEAEERMLIKNPEQFRGIITENYQIDEALGEKIGRWALGKDRGKQPEKPASKMPSEIFDDLRAGIHLSATVDELRTAWSEVSVNKSKGFISEAQLAQLIEAKEHRKQELSK